MGWISKVLEWDRKQGQRNLQKLSEIESSDGYKTATSTGKKVLGALVLVVGFILIIVGAIFVISVVGAIPGAIAFAAGIFLVYIGAGIIDPNFTKKITKA